MVRGQINIFIRAGRIQGQAQIGSDALVELVKAVFHVAAHDVGVYAHGLWRRMIMRLYDSA